METQLTRKDVIDIIKRYRNFVPAGAAPIISGVSERTFAMGGPGGAGLANSLASQNSAATLLTLTPTASNNLTVNHAVSASYDAVYQAAGAEIFRLQSTTPDMLFATSSKLKFRTADTYIYSNDVARLTYAASHHFFNNYDDANQFEIAYDNDLIFNGTPLAAYDWLFKIRNVEYMRIATDGLSATVAGAAKWKYRDASTYHYSVSSGVLGHYGATHQFMAGCGVTFASLAHSGIYTGTLMLRSESNYTMSIVPSATQAASYTLTMPVNLAAGAGYVLASTTGGVLSWANPVHALDSATHTIGSLTNLYIPVVRSSGNVVQNSAISQDVTPGYIYCTAQYLKVSKTIDDVVGHMALNTGVTGYASSEMLAGEDIASGKYVRLYYYNNSWFQGAPLTNSGSIQAGSGATGGMTVGTLANATLAFFTNGVSNTRISITGAGVITLPSPATLTISALSTAGILANSAAGLISSSALGTAGVVPMYSATGLAASVITQTSSKIRIGDAGSAANLLDVYQSVTGGTALSVRNPTAGTGNYGAIFVGADRDTLGQLAATSTTFTPSAPHTADCFSVKSIGVGGLSLIASYASGGTYGPVTIYAGGTAESARFTKVGLGIGCTPATTLAIGGTNAAISITSYDHPTVSTGNYTPVCSRVEFHSAAPATMTLLAGSLPEGTILICTQDNGSSYVTVNGHSMVNGVGCIFIQTHDAGWNCIGFGKAD